MTCQIFGADQHQHAAQDVEAHRSAAEDAALTWWRQTTDSRKEYLLDIIPLVDLTVFLNFRKDLT